MSDSEIKKQPKIYIIYFIDMQFKNIDPDGFYRDSLFYVNGVYDDYEKALCDFTFLKCNNDSKSKMYILKEFNKNTVH